MNMYYWLVIFLEIFVGEGVGGGLDVMELIDGAEELLESCNSSRFVTPECLNTAAQPWFVFCYSGFNVQLKPLTTQ
jgi:hypothetical protein